MTKTPDSHHLLFGPTAGEDRTANELWRQGFASTLRSQRSLRIRMDFHVHHDELHKDPQLRGGVPLLSESAMELVLAHYCPATTYSGSIHNLKLAYGVVDDPIVNDVIEAIALQMPYIRRGKISDSIQPTPDEVRILHKMNLTMESWPYHDGVELLGSEWQLPSLDGLTSDEVLAMKEKVDAEIGFREQMKRNADSMLLDEAA